MAKLPTMISESLPIPVSQRTTQGYESQLVPNAQYQAGQEATQNAKIIEDKQNRDAVLDAQNRSNAARKKVLDTLYGDGQNEGLFSFKGGAALGTEAKYSKSFEDIKAQAMNGLENPVAQKALLKDLDDLNLSNLDNVKRFEMTERNGYRTDLTSARNDVDVQRAGLEYNNPNTMNELLVSAQKTGETSAKLKGAMPGDAIWNQEILQAKSRVLSSQLTAMANSKDTAALLQFSDTYEKYRKSGSLTLESVERFDKIQSVLAPKLNAAKEFGRVVSQQIGYNAPPGKLIEAVMKTESAGDPNAVSPKGARGLMQIMPETALHLAGGNKAIADEILKNPETNRVAGEKYLGDLTKQFGDQRMALAAYNAGPTVVQDWIDGTNKSGKNKDGLKIGDPAKGQITFDQFLAQVPFAETRDYVGKVLRNAGYAGRQGTIDEDTALAYSAGMDEQSGAEFMKMVKQNNEAFTAQNRADLNGTATSIIEEVTKNNGDWSSIPPEVEAHAKENGSWNAVKDYDPKAPSKKEVVSYLYSLDAEQLKSADLDSPEVVGGLSPEDRGRWKKKQEALTSSSVAVTHDIRNGMVEKAMAARGLKKGGSGGDGDENLARVVRVNNLVDLMVDSYSTSNNGRMPGPSEMQKIIDEVFINQTIPTRHGFFGLGEGQKPIYDITLDAISEDDRTIIADRLMAKGVAATDSRIIEMYIKNGGEDTRSEFRKGIEGD